MTLALSLFLALLAGSFMDRPAAAGRRNARPTPQILVEAKGIYRRVQKSRKSVYNGFRRGKLWTGTNNTGEAKTTRVVESGDRPGSVGRVFEFTRKPNGRATLTAVEVIDQDGNEEVYRGASLLTLLGIEPHQLETHVRQAPSRGAAKH